MEVGLLVLSVILALPSLVVFVEGLFGLLPIRRRADESETPHPSVAILVPAHDEAAIIDATIASLRSMLRTQDRVLVVADNCTDDTAARARSAGAEVIERHEASQRGKGYALAFGIEHLAAAPPEVVIVVDADCRVAVDSIPRLARQAAATDRPAQADYLIQSSSARPRASLSAFAFLFRNRVRPRGLHWLGLPVHLTGSGMAFPWQVLRDAPATGSWLVEDLLMGIELALRGHAPRLCPAAVVTSAFPDDEGEAAIGQRRRWEHGQLATMLRQAPRLVTKGLLGLRPGLLALGLDLAVPPLALLVSLLGVQLGVCLALGASGGSWIPAVVSGAATTAVALVVLGAWLRHGRDILPWHHLLRVPLYVLWKLPLYVSFLFRRRERTWQRTKRAGEAPPDADR